MVPVPERADFYPSIIWSTYGCRVALLITMSKKENRLTKWDKINNELQRAKAERNQALNAVDFDTVFEAPTGEKFVNIPVEGYAELASLIAGLHQAVYIINMADLNGTTPEGIEPAHSVMMLNRIINDITPYNEMDDLDKIWQMQEILS